jgi:hypothetical protein
MRERIRDVRQALEHLSRTDSLQQDESGDFVLPKRDHPAEVL